MESDADVHALALLAGWSGASVLALLGFSHGDWAAILAAAISAVGVVIASRNSRRLRRVERHARKRRVVAIKHPERRIEGPEGAVFDEDLDDDQEEGNDGREADD